jgi:hypothetical protein
MNDFAIMNMLDCQSELNKYVENVIFIEQFATLRFDEAE